MLLLLCLTWGAAAVALAVICTSAVVAQGRSPAAKPTSIPAKLVTLAMAGCCLCVAIPMLYDAFGNPLLPERGPSGKWLFAHVSDELMIRLYILVPVPYAFLTFVISERLQEWRAQKRPVTG